MGFNLAGLGAAFKGQQEYDQFLQAKKMRDLQLQEAAMKNDPMSMKMAWDALQNGAQARMQVPPMPGQASVPMSPPMPQNGPQGAPGQMPMGTPPQAPPLEPYRQLPIDDSLEGDPSMPPPLPQAPQAMSTEPKPVSAPMEPPVSAQPPVQAQAQGAPVQLKRDMSLPDAQLFIQQNYGDASPQQKFRALEMVHGYMSQQAKADFQIQTLEQKERISEAQNKIKEMQAQADSEYKKQKAEYDKAKAETEEYRRMLLKAQTLSEPIKPGATAKRADASMISANASATRAAAAKEKASAGETLTDEDARDLAKQAVTGDDSVFKNLGRGAQGAANVIKVRRMMRLEREEVGMKAEDQAIANAEFGGIKAANRSLGNRTAAIGTAVNEAKILSQLALDASSEWERSGIKTLNDLQKFAQSKTASPTLRRFVGANNSFINAYARAINPQGVGTVSDKEHAREMLEVAFSKGDYAATIDQLQQEMEAAQKAPGEAKKEIRELARTPYNSSKDTGAHTTPPKSTVMTPERWAKMKSGDTFIDAQGNTRRKP